MVERRHERIAVSWNLENAVKVVTERMKYSETCVRALYSHQFKYLLCCLFHVDGYLRKIILEWIGTLRDTNRAAVLDLNIVKTEW